MLRALLFLLGCAITAAGVAMIFIPAGLITGGLLLSSVAIAAERDAARRDLQTRTGREGTP